MSVEDFTALAKPWSAGEERGGMMGRSKWLAGRVVAAIPLLLIVSCGKGGAGGDPSAEDGNAALVALSQGLKQPWVLYETGKPENCVRGTMNGQPVLSCDVCATHLFAEYNGNYALSDLVAQRAVFKIPFKRGLSHAQANITPDDPSDGVWVYAAEDAAPFQRAAEPAREVVATRILESEDVEPIGLRLSDRRGYSGRLLSVVDGERNVTLMGSKAVLEEMKAPKARDLVLSLVGSCLPSATAKAPEEAAPSDEPSAEQNLPKEAAPANRTSGFKLATKIGEDTGPPGDDWMEVWFEKSYAMCAYRGDIYDPTIEGSRPRRADSNLIDPVKNKISITRADQVTWNGTPLDLVRLRQYLEVTVTMNPQPDLVVEPEAGAGPILVHEVREAIVRSRVCNGLPKCGSNAQGRLEGTCYP